MAQPPTTLEDQVRASLNDAIASLQKHIAHPGKWSPRERIRFMKCLDQINETNAVLDRARGWGK